MEAESIAGDLRGALQGMAALKYRFKAHPERWHYSSQEEFVVVHGQAYPARLLPKQYRLGEPKMCFRNSAMAAMVHKNLRYVEGYATTGIIPIHHAWCIDDKGLVVDLTWDMRKRDLATSAYFGVTFPRELVYVIIMELEAFPSVLDDWQNDWPILVNDYDPVAAPDQVRAILRAKHAAGG